MEEIDGVCDGHVCRGAEKVGRLGFFLFLGDIFWVLVGKYQGRRHFELLLLYSTLALTWA